MSRVALTIKNAWIGLVFQIIYIVIQFFSRDIFLKQLGDEFIGVVETLKSILQFLNLSELGIGTAVGFSLYKPIYNKNKEKINEIIGYLGFLYKRIGLIIFLLSLILLLFFPYIFEKTTVNLPIVIFLFTSLLISNLSSYFFAYYTFLLHADQKGYINVTISQSVFALRLTLQCLILIYFQDVLLWILMELFTPFIYILILRKKVKKTYPWLILNFKVSKVIRENQKNLLKKIKQVSFHQLGTFVTNSTDNIIIFSFVSPTMVAFVGNYQMVMNNVNLLVGKLFDGTNASIGNLVAENNMKNMLKVFWEFMALRFFLAGCTSIILFVSFEGFITLWLGEKYLLSKTILIVLIIIFYILQVRQPVDSFKQAYGLYDDIWAPIVQSIINLSLSIIFVLQYGVIGVFLGTLISQFVIVMIWRPYYLFKYGFKINNGIYWLGFTHHIFYLLFSYLSYYYLSQFLKITINLKYGALFLNSLKSGFLFLLIYFIILIMFSAGFKNLINRFYHFFLKNCNK